MTAEHTPRPKFDQIAYQRIDPEAIITRYRRARLRLRLAWDGTGAVHACEEADAAWRDWHDAKMLVDIRSDRDTEDAFYAAERAFMDAASGKIAAAAQQFAAALATTRFRPAIEEAFGSLLLRKAENRRRLITAETAPILSREQALVSEYHRLTGDLLVHWGEETRTLGEMEPLLEVPDRAVRKAAHEAVAAAFTSVTGDLDRIFADLFRERSELARKLGFADFAELAYARLERFDYGPREVECLRKLIERYFVPISREIRRQQQKRLSLEQLLWYDLPLFRPEGNPRLKLTESDLIGAADHILSLVSGWKPSFLRDLADDGWADVMARPAKAQGGYCETLYGARRPFILMNAGGTADDLITLMHESGHAYASLRAFEANLPAELHNPTLEICEIHSTALEFLAYPHLDDVFGEQAGAAAQIHLTRALLFIPYACQVDEFQHTVYTTAHDGDPLSLTSLWQELDRRWRPDLNYDGAPFFGDGRQWQRQIHLYSDPFYYIDYVLALFSALELWLQARHNPKVAWEQYDRLCGLGGSTGFRGQLEAAGLTSPFAEDLIKKLAYAVCDYLSL